MTFELNKLQSYDTDFSPKVCNDPSCISPIWASPDPRLLSAIRAQRTALDAPPLNGKVQIDDTNDDKYMYNIPVFYPSFQSITNGQLRYYVTKDLAKPFISTLFSTPETGVIKHKYIDPMGTYKPHYERCTNYTPNSCLSWINDSQLHREDLMSKQLWRRNQNDYSTNKIYGN